MRKENEQEQVREFPKWVCGTLCADAEAESAVVDTNDADTETLDTMQMPALRAYASEAGIEIPEDVTGVKDVRHYLNAYQAED